MRLPIDHWAFSFRLAAAVAVLSLINSLLLPWETSLDLMREGGLVDGAAILFYYLALAVLWLWAPGIDRLTRLAVSTVLLACVARELDLHKALFGMSILKVNFYRRYATGPQIVVALLMIFPVVLSSGYLLLRYGRWLLYGIRDRRPVPMTIVSIFFLLVVSKILDRLLGIVAAFEVPNLTLAARAIQIPLEEPLETLLPLLVVVAVVQAWRRNQK